MAFAARSRIRSCRHRGVVCFLDCERFAALLRVVGGRDGGHSRRGRRVCARGRRASARDTVPRLPHAVGGRRGGFGGNNANFGALKTATRRAGRGGRSFIDHSAGRTRPLPSQSLHTAAVSSTLGASSHLIPRGGARGDSSPCALPKFPAARVELLPRAADRRVSAGHPDPVTIDRKEPTP